MKCKSCKKDIKPFSSFCRHCGADVRKQTEHLRKATKYLDSLSAPYSKSKGGLFSFNIPTPSLHIKRFLSPKTGGFALVILVLSAGVVLAAPRVSDHMEVSEALNEARTLVNEGNYSNALSSLDDATGKWTLPSTQEDVENLRNQIRENQEDKDAYNKALQREEEGNLKESLALLRGIESSYPNYAQVQSKIQEVERKVEEQESQPEGKFSEGERVMTTGVLSVRSASSTDSEQITLQANGAQGAVVSGPAVGEDYTWWEIEYDNGYTGWSVEQYLEKAPEGSTKFSVGDVVRTTVTLRIRENASSDANLVDTMPPGSTGEVLGGPEQGGSYWWWRVGYENGSVGWSAENFLEEASQSSYNPEPQQSTPDPKFSLGGVSEVQADSEISVRENPSTSANRLGTQSAGSTALLMGGPEYSDGYVWWELQYLDGPRGWSVQQYLSEYTPPDDNNSDNSNDSNPSNSSGLPNLATALDQNYDNFQDGIESSHSEIVNFTEELRSEVERMRDENDFDAIDSEKVTEQIWDTGSDYTSARDVINRLEDYENSKGTLTMLLEGSLAKLRDVLDFVTMAKTQQDTTPLTKALNSIRETNSTLDRAQRIIDDQF